ncbi:LysR family transcriptional regulator [Shewanella colwelliana]|uniref:LysR family transcriptional regulator n=1 Tax=Shewanella colwelliana TaxID=23 RepID=A0ABQ4NUB7_SHECO|nr:LysR family transcriptional regulator [Shewanella colwelliana]GIU35094.1 LysR family transcriptional regulator [Shewanella colwelliana]
MNQEISLADIKAFTVIAEAGSFTAAAELLGCSRSYLSRQLTHLEAELGVSLITRTTRAQRLTEQGEQLFSHCKTALDNIASAVAMTMDNAQNLHGHININCVGGFLGEEVVANVVSEFINLHPEVTVNLDFSSERVDLVLGKFDMVFRMGALADSGLVARKLMMIKNGVFASPKYLSMAGIPQHPKDLLRHQCISGSVSHWEFLHQSDVTQKVEVDIVGNVRCKNGRVMKNIALSGNGIARLPYLYCQTELDYQQLTPVFDDWFMADSPFYLIYHKDNYQPERLKAFTKFVTEYFNHHF